MSDGMKVSRKELERWKSMYTSARNKAEKVMQKGDSVIRTFITTSEVQLTAFSMGVVDGKTGGVEVVGVPLGLGLGVLAHGAGFVGLGGESAHHLHAFGDGFLASFFNTLGRGVGLKWANDSKKEGKKADQLPPSGGTPAPPTTGGGTWLSDAQMAELIRRSRQAA